MSPRTVLVYAGTGARGRPVVERLLDGGHSVRLAVSREDDPGVPDHGRVEVVIGDLRDPDGLAAISAGVDAVALQLPVWVSDPAVARGPVEAARAAGVARVVFVAHTAVPDRAVGVVRPDVMREIDSYVRSCGDLATVLRAPLFLGNLTAPAIARGIVDDGVLAYPLAADVRCPWISFDDAAACLVAALEDDTTAGDVLPIGGAESLTCQELAERIGSGLGTRIGYREIPIDRFEAQLSKAVGEKVAALVGAMYGYLSSPEGRPFLDLDAKPTLARLGVTPLPVEAWARTQPWEELAAVGRQQPRPAGQAPGG